MVYYQTYLSDKDLQQLKNHKYSGVDNSILSKLFLNRFWNALVTKLPLWLAPNTITLLGLIIVAISVLFVLNVENQENPWLWVFVAFALMTYTTLDAIDGKQARRTNSSSPLGELFDHGVDSLNTTLGCIPLVYTLSLQHTWALPLFIAVAHTYFYSATWETYHTHTLRLGIINGPVEGTFTICIVYLISAYFGPSMWLGSYKEMFGLQHTSLPDFQMNTLLLSLPLITTFAACFESLPPVISHCRSHNLSLLRAFSRFSPFILYITSFYFWLSGSKIEIVTSSLMMLFTYAVGLEFGMMMTKIILGHMTKTNFPKFFPGLAFLVIGALNSKISFLTAERELILLWSYAIFNTILYSHMCYNLINRLCALFDIYCFSIKHKTKQ